MIYMIEPRAQGARRRSKQLAERLRARPRPHKRGPYHYASQTWASSHHVLQDGGSRAAQLASVRKHRRVAHEPRHACARLKHACARRAADSHDDAHGLRSKRVSQARLPAAPQMASSAISRTDGNLPRHVHAAHMHERRQDGGKPAEPVRPGFDPPVC